MVKNSPTLIADIFAIFQEEVSTVANVTGVLPSLAFQPITTDMTSHFSKNGGNALGISAADGPLNRKSSSTLPPLSLTQLSSTNHPKKQSLTSFSPGLTPPMTRPSSKHHATSSTAPTPPPTPRISAIPSSTKTTPPWSSPCSPATAPPTSPSYGPRVRSTIRMACGRSCSRGISSCFDLGQRSGRGEWERKRKRKKGRSNVI